ncbi:MAG: FecR domain-containing protein [Proteobacteria bacterium]|nr:FecR domain-containing protein [Pseudomonadota bacterium]
MSRADRKALLIKAGAATWLARLRADDRTGEDEAAFREWLAADPAHAAAFEAMNGVWDEAGPAPRDLRGRLPGSDARISRRAVMAGMFVTAGVGGTFAMTQMAAANVYRTEVGEQKHALLPDGTELFLDTDTKLVVDLRKSLRNVVLEYGCANFRVAPDTKRPFAVNAGGSIIQGAQSTFDVRRDGDQVCVVLIQGRATVESIAMEPARVLADGDRLVFTSKKTIKRDKPNLLPLLAWHTGQALFQGETLLEAASEMNRYSALKLVVADARIEDMKVSGLYRVGDNAIFAQALEKLLPVSIRPFEDRIEIVADEAQLTRI